MACSRALVFVPLQLQGENSMYHAWPLLPCGLLPPSLTCTCTVLKLGFSYNLGNKEVHAL